MKKLVRKGFRFAEARYETMNRYVMQLRGRAEKQLRGRMIGRKKCKLAD